MTAYFFGTFIKNCIQMLMPLGKTSSIVGLNAEEMNKRVLMTILRLNGIIPHK
jgi:hypothetical protein